MMIAECMVADLCDRRDWLRAMDLSVASVLRVSSCPCTPYYVTILIRLWRRWRAPFKAICVGVQVTDQYLMASGRSPRLALLQRS